MYFCFSALKRIFNRADLWLSFTMCTFQSTVCSKKYRIRGYILRRVHLHPIPAVYGKHLSTAVGLQVITNLSGGGGRGNKSDRSDTLAGYPTLY